LLASPLSAAFSQLFDAIKKLFLLRLQSMEPIAVTLQGLLDRGQFGG
jgi:hypothetical protein